MYGISSGQHEILNARKETGAVIETPAIYLDMSATGNLKEQYRVLGIRSFDTIPQLGIAIALVGNPRFLDELRKIGEYIEINTTEDTAVAGCSPLQPL